MKTFAPIPVLRRGLAALGITMVQAMASLPPPQISIEQPAGATLADAGSTVAFGTVPLGKASIAKTFTIRNTGAGPLGGLAFSVAGAAAGDFIVSPPAANNVEPGGSLTFDVHFIPSSSGPRSATLQVASDDPEENPFDVAVTGVGSVVAQPSAMVKDVRSGSAGSDPTLLTPLGNDVYFVASDGVHGQELWVTDGSGPGTRLVLDIRPGADSAAPSRLFAAGGLLYFVAPDTTGTSNWIWRSNGNGTGTYPIKEIPWGESSAPSFTQSGGVCHFGFTRQTETPNPFGGAPQTTTTMEIWSTDGTLPGTQLIWSYSPPSPPPGPFPPSTPMFSMNLLDTAGAPLHFLTTKTEMSFLGSTREDILWKLDSSSPIGASSFWSRLSTVGGFIADIGGFTMLGGNLYFQAPGNTSPWAMWRADGSGGSAAILMENIRTYAGAGRSAALGSRIFFEGSDGSGTWRLWQSDGSPGGTAPLPSPVTGVSSIAGFVTMGTALFFGANGGWWGDGEPCRMKEDGEVTCIGDIRPGSAGSYPQNFTPLGDGVYFDADNGTDGREIWKTLAAGGGALRLATISGSTMPAYTGNMVAAGTRLFFTASTPGAGHELHVIETVVNQPDIAVEQPAATNLDNGGGVAFGAIAIGAPVSRTFIIRNTGQANLDNLDVEIMGTHAGDFAVDRDGTAASLAPASTTTFTVTFTPSAGSRSATLRVTSNDPDEATFDIVLTGTGVTARTLLETTIAGAGLSGADADWQAMPFGDGTSNLLKYAFNMNLAAPDSSPMTPGGDSGLPHGRQIESGGQSFWELQFVRRKGSGLVYTPLKSSTLTADSFVPITSPPTVESIDDAWERVIVTEPIDPSTISRYFTRVAVSAR